MSENETPVENIDHPYARENGVEWAPEAWDRVKQAPEFVRPGIRKLTWFEAIMVSNHVSLRMPGSVTTSGRAIDSCLHASASSTRRPQPIR